LLLLLLFSCDVFGYALDYVNAIST